nr:hypothetical protein [Mycobacterium canetti]
MPAEVAPRDLRNNTVSLLTAAQPARRRWLSRDGLLRRLRHTQADAGLHPRPPQRLLATPPTISVPSGEDRCRCHVARVPVVTHDGDFDAVDGVADAAIIRI